ncbi:uncharacterized protein EV154DRAFT_488954 [Mucor mucedo]|uniref:uncharacterized protein n=1 Tax=Mucor mucedo TaxID=29922 RepID=UPI00221F37C4|nr:uncharacterized protein EV154DRAFT_488954 [Mucor mucedo]KAI7864156.1 hypothetical protein EV154DRAFT_488954 [Mucor mucedo]
MELIDIPVFLNNVPRTAPAPAIANSSAPALNSTSPSRMTVSLRQRLSRFDKILQLSIRDSYKECMGYQILPCGCKTTACYRRRTSFCMITFWKRHCFFCCKKAICQKKVRYHYEHLADVEKKKKYCDIVRLPATELAKRYQFRDQEVNNVIKPILSHLTYASPNKT